jgi:hypothetical protein
MKVFSKDPFYIHGDMDILIKLGLFKTNKKHVDLILDQELHRYLPEDVFSDNEEKIEDN